MTLSCGPLGILPHCRHHHLPPNCSFLPQFIQNSLLPGLEGLLLPDEPSALWSQLTFSRSAPTHCHHTNNCRMKALNFLLPEQTMLSHPLKTATFPWKVLLSLLFVLACLFSVGGLLLPSSPHTTSPPLALPTCPTAPPPLILYILGDPRVETTNHSCCPGFYSPTAQTTKHAIITTSFLPNQISFWPWARSLADKSAGNLVNWAKKAWCVCPDTPALFLPQATPSILPSPQHDHHVHMLPRLQLSKDQK